MLKVWFNFSDEAIEDTIYDSYAMKRYMRMNFTNESVPVSATLGKFRHLMEEDDLWRKEYVLGGCGCPCLSGIMMR